MKALLGDDPQRPALGQVRRVVVSLRSANASGRRALIAANAVAPNSAPVVESAPISGGGVVSGGGGFRRVQQR